MSGASAMAEQAEGSRGWGRWLRVVVGLAVLGAPLAIYLPYLLNTITREAVVNARVVPVYAPIEGEIRGTPPAAGTAVTAGAGLLAIANPTLDRGRLGQLEAEATALRARHAALGHAEQDLVAIAAELEARMASYRDAASRRSATLVDEAAAAVDAAQAQLRERTADLERKRRSRPSGAVSAAGLEAAEAAAAGAAAELSQARRSRDRSAIEHDWLAQGVFVADTRNDVPYSQQRIDEVRIRLVELRSELGQAAASLATAEAALADERRRVAMLAEARVAAPRSGIVWQPLALAGDWVGRRAELLRMIDCDDLFVTARLSTRYFDSIRPGDAASVRLPDGERELAGIVEGLRGMGASDPNDRLAAAMPPLEPGEFVAVVRLDGRQLRDVPGEFCHVGRAVEVRFPAATPLASGLGSALRDAAARLGMVGAAPAAVDLAAR